MKIAIIGLGNVGKTLAQSWSQKSHEIFIGARNESDTETLKFGKSINATICSPVTAVESCDVILLSVPWSAISSLAEQLPLQNKIVIDCTNPLKPDLSGLSVGTTTSGGEILQELAPAAKVVKAFNTVGFNVMANPVFQGRKVVLTFCGNDAEAKKTVMQLIEDIGFEPMDMGPLSSARLTEPFALLWIHAAMKFRMGRNFAFSLVRDIE
jgi:8-hydroxy-5-deazaflavin:NADPH oxidoreductase